MFFPIPFPDGLTPECLCCQELVISALRVAQNLGEPALFWPWDILGKVYEFYEMDPSDDNEDFSVVKRTGGCYEP